MTPILDKETARSITHDKDYKFVRDIPKGQDKPVIAFEEEDAGEPNHLKIAHKYNLGAHMPGPLYKNLPDLQVGDAGNLSRSLSGKLVFYYRSSYCHPRDETTARQETKIIAEEAIGEAVVVQETR